jgi:hypothetical protein
LVEDYGGVDIVKYSMCESASAVVVDALSAAAAVGTLLMSDVECDQGINSKICGHDLNVFKLRRF